MGLHWHVEVIYYRECGNGWQWDVDRRDVQKISHYGIAKEMRGYTVNIQHVKSTRNPTGKMQKTVLIKILKERLIL